MEKNKKKSIVFGITKLDLGGAERVLVDMCNKLCEQFDITIFTIYSGGVLEKELKPKIKKISLYKKRNKFIPIYLLLFRRSIYKKYLREKYDKEIAFLEGPITRLFSYHTKDNIEKRESSRISESNIESIKEILANKSCNQIAWVHNDIKRVFGTDIKSRIKKFLDKEIYKKYDLIVFVSKENQKSFNELYGNNFNEKVIYNYIDKKRILKLAEEKIDDLKFKANDERQKLEK